MRNLIPFVFFSVIALTACENASHDCLDHDCDYYKTKNAIIIVMDGARYTETFGDSTFQNISRIKSLIAPKGVVNTSFYNDGSTYTIAGHTAICTGYYQEINNAGAEYPAHPSIFQSYYQSTNRNESWIVTSKDKLSVLANSSDPEWQNNYLPFSDCGINGTGVGSGYRNDSLTLLRAQEILNNNHPRLMLVNFKEPDASAHSGDWNQYLDAIAKTDRYIYELCKSIETNSFYSGSTAIFIVNDHGRHSGSLPENYSGHGCSCEGCRHVMLVATGPDFKQNSTITTHYDLRDIPATISEMMYFNFHSDGEVMYDLFESPHH